MLIDRFVSQIIRQLAAIGHDGIPLPSTVLNQSQRSSSCSKCGHNSILLATYCTHCEYGDGELGLDQQFNWRRDDGDEDEDDRVKDDRDENDQVDEQEVPAKRPRLSEPKYAHRNPIHPNFRIKRDKIMEEFFSDPSHACGQKVEVRAVPSLSIVNQPCQLGVYAVCEIPAGENIMFYSSQVTQKTNAIMIKSGTDYVKYVKESGHSMVLDGKPVADMYRRIVPRDATELAALDTHAAAAFEPLSTEYDSTDMQLFASSAKGFMVNTVHHRKAVDGEPMVKNCSWMKHAKCKASSLTGQIQVLRAHSVIRQGDEVVCPPYQNEKSRSSRSRNQNQATPSERSAKWIADARQSSTLRAISYIQSQAASVNNEEVA